MKIIRKTLLFIIISILFSSCKYDTEYLGHYVVKIRYDEPWNEYVHRTCTREVYDGTDSEGNSRYRTESYDCSYVDYHSAKWSMFLEDGSETSLSESKYNIIKSRFKSTPIYIDMHRHYHTIDGDRYEILFDGDRNKMWTVTRSGYYKNKILKSKSVFNFSEVSKEEFTSLGLYDYPKDFDYFIDQNPIIGIDVPTSVIDSFKYLNAFYGGKYQFRCYVMVWKNQPIQISKKEQDFLVGGNKNEVITCISIDDNSRIQWVNSFSWEDKPYISVSINHLYNMGDSLDLMVLNRHLLKEVPIKWKRKEFKDFNYL